LTIHGSTIFRSLAWSPDGSKLATGDLEGKIEVWDARRERTLGILVTGGWLRRCGFILLLGMIPDLLVGWASRGFRLRRIRQKARLSHGAGERRPEAAPAVTETGESICSRKTPAGLHVHPCRRFANGRMPWRWWNCSRSARSTAPGSSSGVTRQARRRFSDPRSCQIARPPRRAGQSAGRVDCEERDQDARRGPRPRG